MIAEETLIQRMDYLSEKIEKINLGLIAVDDYQIRKIEEEKEQVLQNYFDLNTPSNVKPLIIH